jgi:hypothetical protein
MFTLQASLKELSKTQPKFLRWYQSLLQDPLSHMLSSFRYRTTHLYTHAPRSIVLGVTGCIQEFHIKCEMS